MPVDLSPQDRRLANFLCEYPMIRSTPFYFGNPSDHESPINNGTATLLKKGERLFVVTNHHVLAKLDERRHREDGVMLQVGGVNVDGISDRIVMNDADIDVAILDFSDHGENDFYVFGDVPTEFFDLGDVHPPGAPGTVVAFGGYPGAFRIRADLNHVSFHTFSSGASIVLSRSESNIIVSINHDESAITSLTPTAPPADIGGMSGGPVFEISAEGPIATFRFAGIIVECNENLEAMFVKPVTLFADAFR